MPKHEHFEELCALAAVDQASFEEYRELQEHLQECASCMRTSHQFNLVLDQLPIPKPSAQDADLQNLQTASYRKRFLERARAEGMPFTPEMFGESRRGIGVFSFFGWRLPWRAYALGAASAVLLAAIAVPIMFPNFLRWSMSEQAVGDAREIRTATPVRGPEPEVPAADPRDAIIARLEQAEVEAQSRLDALQQELRRARADYRMLLQESERGKDRTGQLQERAEQDKQQLANAKTEIDKLSNEKNELTASLVAQQFRIKELSDEIQNQMAAVERERQLTAVARDVRELMGARNLHIIDVADLDGQGKPRKSFGRVFYIEGESLIFYAFDLSEKGSASKVAFQAWGQTPDRGRSVRNLGVFRVDNQAQKRWVLKVDSPELLSSIESIFVTVEPAPGRDKPSGRKLLYAYLGIQANHP